MLGCEGGRVLPAALVLLDRMLVMLKEMGEGAVFLLDDEDDDVADELELELDSMSIPGLVSRSCWLGLLLVLASVRSFESSEPTDDEDEVELVELDDDDEEDTAVLFLLADLFSLVLLGLLLVLVGVLVSSSELELLSSDFSIVSFSLLNSLASSFGLVDVGDDDE